ncbi:hypothetical protein BGW38_000732 [Lunasporangiospora selenospora]|uniref:Uncharacterized protein n=1 Tax=Lunasporangiospora selenospora TaxID=979761 RepID=A0A9P6G2F8_9FUNG|nr:hypothetical protein BGW38_000732 [Lunasporangiospora selenospora]
MPPTIKVVCFFIVCFLIFQIVFIHKSTQSSSGFRDQARQHLNGFGTSQKSSSSSSRLNKDRHPSVPLSLHDLEILDELSDTIAVSEAYRVFENKDIGRIHGTRIKGNPDLVKTIREQIDCWTTHGQWVRQDKEFTPLKHIGDARFTKCDKSFMKALDREGEGHYLGEYDHVNERFLVREAVKYRWVPDEKICGPRSVAKGPNKMGFADERAEYQPYSKPNFCQILDQRNVLVVGDVTQYQIHDVILSAFESSFACFGELGCLHHAAHGLCVNVYLKFARNDLLSVPKAYDPEDEEFPIASTVEQHWATEDMLAKYKVVLLNRGLVWRPDEVFLSELVITIRHLWRYYPDVLFIYRATHPGSPNCSKFKNQGEDEAIADKSGRSIIPGTILQQPLQSPAKRQEHHNGEKEEFRPSLADIQRQNKIAKRVVEAAGGIYLDTQNMYAVRPDGRMGDGDCSRFCAPGPLDAYADLIFNTLKVLQV